MTRESERQFVADAAARIVRCFESASAADLAAGAGWYARAHATAVAMDPASPSRAAGCIAALSPRTHWAQNVQWAGIMLKRADAGGSLAPAFNYPLHRERAWEIARGADPLDILGGPKVRAFYRAIMGDDASVVVDVWAARAAGVDLPRGVSPAMYKRLALAYRLAARYLKQSPTTVQAAVWVHTRGKAE